MLLLVVVGVFVALTVGVLVGLAAAPRRDRSDPIVATVSPSPPPGSNNHAACGCAKVFQPVCRDGQTYANPCIAKCMGVTGYSDGACADSPCPCTSKAEDPVCARGLVFGGVCPAGCDWVSETPQLC